MEAKPAIEAYGRVVLGGDLEQAAAQTGLAEAVQSLEQQGRTQSLAAPRGRDADVLDGARAIASRRPWTVPHGPPGPLSSQVASGTKAALRQISVISTWQPSLSPRLGKTTVSMPR